MLIQVLNYLKYIRKSTVVTFFPCTVSYVISKTGRDENLLVEAKEKKLITHKLRPDLIDENGNWIG